MTRDIGGLSVFITGGSSGSDRAAGNKGPPRSTGTIGRAVGVAALAAGLLLISTKAAQARRSRALASSD
ncbi:MAG TPA: hypothetical protein VGN97_22050 [Mesorhizobium sp.]|nr:hypothetical protein [Mesorhizobium sp.]